MGKKNKLKKNKTEEWFDSITRIQNGDIFSYIDELRSQKDKSSSESKPEAPKEEVYVPEPEPDIEEVIVEHHIDPIPEPVKEEADIIKSEAEKPKQLIFDVIDDLPEMPLDQLLQWGNKGDGTRYIVKNFPTGNDILSEATVSGGHGGIHSCEIKYGYKSNSAKYPSKSICTAILAALSESADSDFMLGLPASEIDAFLDSGEEPTDDLINLLSACMLDIITFMTSIPVIRLHKGEFLRRFGHIKELPARYLPIEVEPDIVELYNTFPEDGVIPNDITCIYTLFTWAVEAFTLAKRKYMEKTLGKSNLKLSEDISIDLCVEDVERDNSTVFLTNTNRGELATVEDDIIYAERLSCGPMYMHTMLNETLLTIIPPASENTCFISANYVACVESLANTIADYEKAYIAENYVRIANDTPTEEPREEPKTEPLNTSDDDKAYIARANELVDKAIVDELGNIPVPSVDSQISEFLGGREIDTGAIVHDVEVIDADDDETDLSGLIIQPVRKPKNK